MADIGTDMVEGWGDARLAVHRTGQGRPVLMLHGLFSSAEVNWIKFGHAARIADAGFEAIMPDLRAHGASDAPHDPDAYPEDVLVRDVETLVEALGLTDYDLVGFSLGARTAVRSVLAGLKPRKLVLGGMGLEGLAGWARRSAFFVDAIDRFDEIRRGDPAYFARSFMKTMNVDRIAARQLLQSVDDTPPDALDAVTMPTLVVCGAEDRDNGSPTALADALPHGSYTEVPGTHMSSVTERKFGEAIAQFLSG
ncbi:alpha/beta hydrolase [Novosphingobium marinum]|uniref:Pimeloyl-ACP methyl ester carboxylesterase n=1 Tax=Novosphingobium marinum TaxID=1514948 RepID=A0A7Z0BU28_9SPHN|nr:alpha/beta fold hydrolase [Novosphingobium marinum]NYH93862.1 pimeloyl-ACP methyl ester carboxylesterase [Novosphingobium marinum]GGC17851.1 alpha/beta hydrolase [Novosphingobium marinum]